MAKTWKAHFHWEHNGAFARAAIALAPDINKAQEEFSLLLDVTNGNHEVYHPKLVWDGNCFKLSEIGEQYFPYDTNPTFDFAGERIWATFLPADKANIGESTVYSYDFPLPWGGKLEFEISADSERTARAIAGMHVSKALIPTGERTRRGIAENKVIRFQSFEPAIVGED